MCYCANGLKRGVSHCVLKRSDASHQRSLATLEGSLNPPSFRFDEEVRAESKHALAMPSEEEKEAQPPTGGRRAG